MPATRKKIIAVTNSWALVLPSNHEQPGSTAISTVNNHTWHQHDKLTIIKLNAVPRRHLAPSKLMPVEAKIWVVVTMPSLCLLSGWRLLWTGRGQVMLKVTMKMDWTLKKSRTTLVVARLSLHFVSV
jgi:hypothetical protein